MAMFTRIINIVLGDRKDLAPIDKPEPLKSNYDIPIQERSVVAPSPSADDPILFSLNEARNGLLNALTKHRKVAPEDALFLERIEISAQGEHSRKLLEDFFREFRQAALVAYVRRELVGDLHLDIVLDQFTGIIRTETISESTEKASESRDIFDAVLSGQGTTGSASDFEVRLIGHWTQKPLSGHDTGVAQRSGPKMHLTLWDADSGPEGRSISVENYPMALGSKRDPGNGDSARIYIAGEYVSGLHGTLNFDGTVLTVSDGPSRNGLWHNTLRVEAGKPVHLTAGDWLRFSSATDQDTARYPRLRIDHVENPKSPSWTPVSTPVTMGTPVAGEDKYSGTAQVKPILAQLSVNDATGSHQLDLTDLPFSIGRSHGQSYVVPDANEGVSGHHLEIVQFDEQGALVKHAAFTKNGCVWADAAKDMLPASFHWSFGQTLLLAAKYTKAPPVRLTLRKAS